MINFSTSITFFALFASFLIAILRSFFWPSKTSKLSVTDSFGARTLMDNVLNGVKYILLILFVWFALLLSSPDKNEILMVIGKKNSLESIGCGLFLLCLVTLQGMNYGHATDRKNNIKEVDIALKYIVGTVCFLVLLVSIFHISKFYFL